MYVMQFLKLAETFVDGGDLDSMLVKFELVVSHKIVFYEGFADLALYYL